MTQDPWTDRLSEYLDGELPEWERHALESHLESCAECSLIVSDLRRVVRRARTLKNPPPATDLWPGIAARIGAGIPKAQDVVDLDAQRRVRRRWAFSLPQLAAAGIALMTVSGGAVWFMSGAAHQSVVSAPVLSSPPEGTPAVSVAMRPNASQSYAAAVADLERVLADGRGKLDTTTVRIIEQNLAAIDRAIAEAQRALDADSANLYLNTHLAETMRRKLDLLRQAAALVPVS
jgi:predicted anti-sigma-YlaC factor YlaD